MRHNYRPTALERFAKLFSPCYKNGGSFVLSKMKNYLFDIIQSSDMHRFNVITVNVNVNFDDFFALSTNINTRGHKYKLFKPRCTASIRQKFFVDRVINVWNALPSTTNFASLNVSGIALKRLISLLFLVCNIFFV